MQKLALFDLDDTLVDRRAAFTVWAEEFAAARGLGDRDVTFLVLAGTQHAGPMDGFFATICDAFELGGWRPLGVAANRAFGGWVIGDSLTLDVAGGHAAGMHTIWLRPPAGPRSFDGPAPDLVVDTVADAVDALLAQR